MAVNFYSFYDKLFSGDFCMHEKEKLLIVTCCDKL